MIVCYLVHICVYMIDSIVIFFFFYIFFFFKQKTAYEMRISDWSSDVCSSDLTAKPDLDNVAKMVCDCMERAGALPRGDSRVSMGEMSKVWAERGGVYVTMRPATTSRPMPTTAPAPSWLASDTA